MTGGGRRHTPIVISASEEEVSPSGGGEASAPAAGEELGHAALTFCRAGVSCSRIGDIIPSASGGLVGDGGGESCESRRCESVKPFRDPVDSAQNHPWT